MERYHNIDVNDKRVLRICRKLNIKSTIKYSNNGCTRQASNSQYIAENILNREFTADAPNEKWLTDVTEFHYYIGIEKRKVYLSAILLDRLDTYGSENFKIDKDEEFSDEWKVLTESREEYYKKASKVLLKDL